MSDIKEQLIGKTMWEGLCAVHTQVLENDLAEVNLMSWSPWSEDYLNRTFCTVTDSLINWRYTGLYYG